MKLTSSLLILTALAGNVLLVVDPRLGIALLLAATVGYALVTLRCRSLLLLVLVALLCAGCSLVSSSDTPSAAVCRRVETELYIADGYPVHGSEELQDACGCRPNPFLSDHPVHDITCIGAH